MEFFLKLNCIEGWVFALFGILLYKKEWVFALWLKNFNVSVFGYTQIVHTPMDSELCFDSVVYFWDILLHIGR